MMHCCRCLYSANHPLNLVFDEEGVCSGCKIHEEKDTLDWDERWSKLETITSEYRSISKKNYDCIIPVSGARDSYFVVHIVKNKLNMNPLLVCYNKHFNNDVGMRNLANLRTRLDCDIVTQTVNPDSVKRITRETLRRFGSLYWHCLAGETVFPVQIAVRMKIPLIIWGAHQGLDQVGMFSHLDEVEMTRKYRKEHDLLGFEAEDLIGEMENLQEEHLHQYYYPDNYYMQRIGVRGIYLNNYIRWDSRMQHEEMINTYKFETLTTGRTFDFYNDVDSYVYLDLHDHIKDVKHGYTKVLDHACREIRLGRLSKARAIELVEHHYKTNIKYVELFCEWLGVTREALHFIIDQHRNTKFWRRDEKWNWQRKQTIIHDEHRHNHSLLSQIDKHKEYIITDKYKSSDANQKYLLVGHGNRL